MGHVRLALGFALVGVVSLAACSAAQEPNGSDTSDLINGDIAAPDAFPSTMQVVGNCTVTKVGERAILTAAHCVRDTFGNLRGEFVEGRTMNLVVRGERPGTRQVTITRTVLHPQIAHLCSTRGCNGRASDERRDAPDVAIIEVEGGLDGVPIAEVDLEPALAGDEVTILGYGCVGDVWGRSDGELRFLDTRIVPVRASVHEGGLFGDDAEGLATIDANYNVTPGPTRIPAAAVDGGEASDGGEALDGGADTDGGAPEPERAAGLCPGDSGGALYRKGTNLVVGVNASYTFLPSGRVPVTNWQARVDADSRWGVAAWLESLGVKTATPCAERGCRPAGSAADLGDGGMGDARDDGGADGDAGSPAPPPAISTRRTAAPA
jgi:hypothetical protein